MRWQAKDKKILFVSHTERIRLTPKPRLTNPSVAWHPSSASRRSFTARHPEVKSIRPKGTSMNDHALLAMHRWSTADVAPSKSLEYYAAAAGSALVPMSVECSSRSNFHASIEAASFGPLELLRMFGSAHSAARGDPEIARSERRLYTIVVNRLAPWRVVQRGRAQLRPGDAILLDTALPSELNVGTYELINVSMTQDFIEQWVPDPEALTTRRLDRDGRWSAALAAFASQLTPEFATSRCPLPTEVVTQQFGVLLMLASGAFESGMTRVTAAETALNRRIVEQLQERISEVNLTASRIAESLGLAERSVHMALAAHGQTFAALLVRLRLRRADQLRASPVGRKMELDELARSAGFKDGACLASASRNRASVA
jgi:AraC family transcriptional activator of tynA and feaB